MNYILGLDMGIASIGWAVLSKEERFIKTGVRIFPAGFDAINTGKESNSNDARRTSRGMRRRIRRKAQRKLLLRKNLESLGWIPSSQHERDNSEVHAWEKLDPYTLRHKALEEKVTLFELGRILLHLNQRRGFLSLRKSQDTSSKDTKGILGEMSELENEIAASGHQTLGNFLYHMREDDLQENSSIPSIKLRDRHLRRSLIHQEFDLIWKTQQKFYPEVLTDTLRYGKKGRRENPTSVITPEKREETTLLEQFGLENLLFFQRRVYWPTSSIGLCQLEQPLLFAQLKENGLLSPNKKRERKELETGIHRIPIADRRFQEFRMLCEVNNLRLINDEVDSTDERVLTSEERAIVLEYCSGTADAKIDQIKKNLVKHLKVSSHLSLHFNLEAGGRKSISGMKTDHTMKSTKALGKRWLQFSDLQKNEIIGFISDPALIDDDLQDRLSHLTYLSAEDVEILLRIDLGSSRGNLCLKAIENLLPHLREGMRYMSSEEEGDSALHHAGYTRSDEQKSDELDLLPRFDDPQYTWAQSITSPVVRRALTELRKVVNGLIRIHGKPEYIHVEMARDLKMSSDKRKDYNTKARKREAERKKAASEIEKHGLIANRDAIERYLLWQEQTELCAYSGQAISLAALFSGDIDVDHILPYSRSADNSYTNKVVCYRQHNATKGNRTPYEWLASADPTEYDRLLDFAKRHLKGGKYKRFIMTEIPSDFLNRDLVDTAWMAKAARGYLAQLYPTKEHYRVKGTKGKHTATLRDHWKLNGLLRHDGVELKSRDDHRHHALDGVMIALTSKRRTDAIVRSMSFQQLAPQPAKEEGKRIYRLKARVEPHTDLALPWDTFREDVKASLNSIWVSHRPKKKVSGALHKETYYGKTEEGRLVVRKPVSALSNKDLMNIRDEAIAEHIQLHLSEGGTLDDVITMPSGLPIKKVRVLVDSAHLTLREGEPHEIHVWSDRTHHVSIFSLGDGKCVFSPVNLLEATKRKKTKAPIHSLTPPAEHPEAEFLFHISLGETIMCTIDGLERLFIYKTMNTNTGQMKFAEHTDATQGNKDPLTGKSILRTAIQGSFLKNFPNPQKVTILPTGEIRRAQ